MNNRTTIITRNDTTSREVTSDKSRGRYGQKLYFDLYWYYNGIEGPAWCISSTSDSLDAKPSDSEMIRSLCCLGPSRRLADASHVVVMVHTVADKERQHIF